MGQDSCWWQHGLQESLTSRGLLHPCIELGLQLWEGLREMCLGAELCISTARRAAGCIMRKGKQPKPGQVRYSRGDVLQIFIPQWCAGSWLKMWRGWPLGLSHNHNRRPKSNPCEYETDHAGRNSCIDERIQQSEKYSKEHYSMHAVCLRCTPNCMVYWSDLTRDLI